MTSKYFKPSLLLMGESNRDMRKKNKTKPKTRCNDGWTPSDDNGKVMTGEAFKWLK